MEGTMNDNHWKEQYTREHERLIAALGEITDSGIVEQIEHIGATSVPGLLGQPSVDIALAVWPFPLEDPVLDNHWHPWAMNSTPTLQALLSSAFGTKARRFGSMW